LTNLGVEGKWCFPDQGEPSLMSHPTLDYFGPSPKTKRAYWHQWVASAASAVAIVAMNAIFLKIASNDGTLNGRDYISARIPDANEAMAILFLLLVPLLWVRTSRIVVLVHLLVSVVLPYIASTLVPAWIGQMPVKG